MLSLKEARFSLRFHITPKSPHPVDEKLEWISQSSNIDTCELLA